MTACFTGPLFKCFGSKWMASRKYTRPNRSAIIGHFGGSAGYELRYSHEVERVWIREQGELELLWFWLINRASEADVREIPVGIPEMTDIRRLGMSPGQALLLKNWQRTNNVGNCWTISPWGNLPGQWTENTRARVAEEIQMLKHWRLTRAPERHPGVHFIDPPYLYNYKYGVRPPSYEGIALTVAQLCARGDQVIACEAVCPKTGSVPDYLPFTQSHRQVTSRRKASQSHHSAELIYQFG